MNQNLDPVYVLYNYWRSSASWRVRIVLHLKGITFEYVPVHLLKDGGKQFSAEYEALNPMKQVPTLEQRLPSGERFLLGQSVAIMEYLEEQHPEPALLPADARGRALVRQLVETINSGIQPLQNLSVMAKVREDYQGDAGAWTRYWVARGLKALEAEVQQTAGLYCYGDQVTLADACLVPQLGASQRFGVDLTPFPTLVAIGERCQALASFQKSHPAAQVDAEV